MIYVRGDFSPKMTKKKKLPSYVTNKGYIDSYVTNKGLKEKTKRGAVRTI